MALAAQVAAGKSLVEVLVEETPQGIGRIRLIRGPDASTASFAAAMQQTVAPGSTVRTDDWNGYGELPGLGYPRQMARAEATVGENLLPLAKRVASLLKRWLLGTHQGQCVRRTWITTWMSSRSDSTGGRAALGGCCSAGR